jgi:hypothetical protein
MICDSQYLPKEFTTEDTEEYSEKRLLTNRSRNVAIETLCFSVSSVVSF